MLYTGIDIIEIARIRHAAERWGERFLRRVFTAGELSACGYGAGEDAEPRYASLAARWAAKEAAAKALGVGLWRSRARADEHAPPVAFTDIEVVRDGRGRPLLRLTGAAAAVAAELGLGDLALSLSHSHDYAVALPAQGSGPKS